MENKKVIYILIAVIVVMIIILSYFVIIKPGLENSAQNHRVEGYNVAINSILTQLQQQGYVQLTIGNQTLFLVPYNPQNTTR